MCIDDEELYPTASTAAALAWGKVVLACTVLMEIFGHNSRMTV
jgi:hypothetical protein